MAITDRDFEALVRLIEDGELDERMIDLQTAIDDRNGRRKNEILRLVKSVWGHDAEIVTDDQPAPRNRSAAKTPIEYQPDEGPAIPASSTDAVGGDWATPIASMSGGVGMPTGEQPTFSPVADPIVSGGGFDPFGDSNPDIISTGAQIG